MHRTRSANARFIGAGLCVLLLTAGGLAVGALQSAPTEEEYGALMTEIRFTVGDAEQHVDARYWPELGEDLERLIPMFRQVEAFWTARGTDDAVGFAGEALAALNALEEAGAAMSVGAARAAITTLRGTCESCHEIHREQMDDGYRIKPGS
ncbi:MAG: hypothetical protein IH939_14250 [Acidobacteria bacterium]|nr:hypothetical protein [Acidobacteriota bacterium]